MFDNDKLNDEEINKLKESFKAKTDTVKTLFKMMHDFEIVAITDVPGYAFRVRNAVDGHELCVCKTRIDAELVIHDHQSAVSYFAMGVALREQEHKISEMIKEKEAARMRDYCIPHPEPVKPADPPKSGEDASPEFVPMPEGGYEWPMPPVADGN